MELQVTRVTQQLIIFFILMMNHLQVGADTHVIYDQDDRIDYTEFDSPLLRSLSESVAAQIPRQFLKPKNMGQEYLVDGRFLGRAHNLCPNERYFYDVTAAECSSFLIDKDLILTAGHCVPYLNESCSLFSSA